MLLTASGGVKAGFMERSGCRGAVNGTTACIPGGCAWPAAVGHDYCPRGTSAVFVAERDGDSRARSHAVWLVGYLVAVRRADVQSRGSAEQPDCRFVGIELVVAVAVDIEQVALFPNRVVAACAAVRARTEYRPFAAFDGFAACQVQRRDQRVDRGRHALACGELLKGWNRNGGDRADDGQGHDRLVETEGAFVPGQAGFETKYRLLSRIFHAGSLP